MFNLYLWIKSSIYQVRFPGFYNKTQFTPGFSVFFQLVKTGLIWVGFSGQGFSAQHWYKDNIQTPIIIL